MNWASSVSLPKCVFPQQAASGNLLITDCFNHRVQVGSSSPFACTECVFDVNTAHGSRCMQEMSLEGEYVRTLGDGDLLGAVYGVDASSEVIVASALCETYQVFVFDATSGELVRSLGPAGPAEGQLSSCRGLRITPDGQHVLITEFNGHRLSLFTLAGQFLRCIGVGVVNWPSDVDFASNGDILVSDLAEHRVYVFTSDGSTLLRTIGDPDEEDAFHGPTALAMQSSTLYVLEQNTARVQVFN